MTEEDFVKCYLCGEEIRKDEAEGIEGSEKLACSGCNNAFDFYKCDKCGEILIVLVDKKYEKISYPDEFVNTVFAIGNHTFCENCAEELNKEIQPMVEEFIKG